MHPFTDKREETTWESHKDDFCTWATLHDRSITDPVQEAGVKPTACGTCIAKDPEHEEMTVDTNCKSVGTEITSSPMELESIRASLITACESPIPNKDTSQPTLKGTKTSREEQNSKQ